MTDPRDPCGCAWREAEHCKKFGPGGASPARVGEGGFVVSHPSPRGAGSPFPAPRQIFNPGDKQ